MQQLKADVDLALMAQRVPSGQPQSGPSKQAKNSSAATGCRPQLDTAPNTSAAVSEKAKRIPKTLRLFTANLP